jgi:hypothetical protein
MLRRVGLRSSLVIQLLQTKFQHYARFIDDKQQTEQRISKTLFGMADAGEEKGPQKGPQEISSVTES